MKKIVYFLFISILFCACKKNVQPLEKDITIDDLAFMFQDPPMEYRPYVWWHWMGSNFSKEGITKDLEAMKEAGIGGATIFNLTSAVQESQAPLDNTPWPDQTYRSDHYWEALVHAASEAKRLNLKLGLHNSPGYSTTGGPWIDEKRGMQKVIFSKIKIEGNQNIRVQLEKPVLPVYKGWGSDKRQATFYQDIAVIAVPVKKEIHINEVLDISGSMNANGLLIWEAGKGTWDIYRIGHAPTMAVPHPVPDDLIGKVLEVDKMSKEQNVYHWQNVLGPLTEHLQKYIGNTFTHILVDSYEAGEQNWTPGFREKFNEIKGYDPVPWIIFREYKKDNKETKQFDNDLKEVINRLYIDNGWKVAKEMINNAGLQFFWEPYKGPFNTIECVSIPDLPMGEFWSGRKGAISSEITNAAKEAGKRLVGAEAFTGRPEISQYNEDPASLKHSADGSFLSGANWLFLHHWVHQPLDDEYQPGMGMGWWGTHFGRHQTWSKPGKAFFRYLSRCQMLLQQGNFVSTKENVLHRSMPDAELYFVTNSSETNLNYRLTFDADNCIPELWDADKGTIRRANNWGRQNDSTYVDLQLHPDESVFVIFPKNKSKKYDDLVLAATEIVQETNLVVEGTWDVTFEPKLENPFKQVFTSLSDFSENKDAKIKYFSGTATYKQQIDISKSWVNENTKILLDLGKVNDIVELRINKKDAGILWYPPYKADITRFLKAGKNRIEIKVTNNWANRLIGDEQYPADFEWGQDRGITMGRALKEFPEWVINKQARPSQGRKTFNIWYYYRQDSPLKPAGLVGPVIIIKQEIKIIAE